MHQNRSSVWFDKSPEEISLDGDIFKDLKEFYKSMPNSSKLNKILRPQVLAYACSSAKSIISHFNEIKPTSKYDARLKLCIYTRYNSHLNIDILRSFAKCRHKFNFRFYDNVSIFGERHNPLCIYLRKHLVPEKMKTFTKKNFKSLHMLMKLVDLEERDQLGDNAFNLSHVDTDNRLYEKAKDISDYHIGMDLLSIIERAIKSSVSLFTLKREYLKGTEHARNHKRFKELSKRYDINIEYCIEYVKVTINHRNPLIRLHNHA